MWTRPVMLGLLVVGHVTGQSMDPSERQRIFGVVRGAPESASVVVTLVSRPFKSLNVKSGVDRVVTEVDARGRFRAMLLRGRSYSAWATTVPAESKSYLASPIVEGVVAGSPLRLLVADRLRSPVSLKFAQDAAWRAWSTRGRLSARIVIPCANPDLRALTIRADGASLVPSVPGTRAIVEVVTPGGDLIFQREVSLVVGERRDAVEVTLRPPRIAVIKVTRASDGSAVSGATVRQRVATATVGVEELWSAIGTSDAEGIVVLRTPGNLSLASQTSRQHLYCRVEKEGFSEMRFGRSFELIAPDDFEARRSAKRAPYTVKLVDGCRLAGRILLRKGVPARRTLIHAIVTNATGKAIPSNLNGSPRYLMTDEEGRFAIDRLGPRFLYRLSAFLSNAQLASLARERSAAIGSVVPVSAGSGAEPGEDVDLGDLDLSTWRLGEIIVRKHDGSPAPFARIMAAEKDLRSYGRLVNVHAAIEMRSDRLGRLRTLLPTKRSYAVAAGLSGGFGNGSLDAPGSERGKNDLDLSIVLSKPLAIRGRVVGIKGQPVAGARISVHPVSGVGRGSVGQLYRRLTNLNLRSDGDGRFRAWAPMEFSTYYLYARVQIGKRWFSTTSRNIVEVEDEPVRDLELETNVPEASGGKGK